MSKELGQIGGTGSVMPISPAAFHTSEGCAFLGIRTRRDGSVEIVHDRLGVRRSVWRVTSGSVGLSGLQEACSRAINADDCMATLYVALTKGGVRIECVEERLG